VPAGKVSNELVHEVDFFTTLVTAAGGTVPADRQIDGMDMADFLLGGAGESGRDVNLCLQGSRLQLGPITQYVTALVKPEDRVPQPPHGIEHQTG
jgi:arylsulfatase